MNSGGRGCNEPILPHYTPAWQQSKTLSQNKQTNKQTNKKLRIKERSHKENHIKIKNFWLGVVTHTCNPSSLESRGRWITRSRDPDHPGQQGETPSLLKIQKISRAWWHVSVIPLLRRLRQENCLNPGGGGCGDHAIALQPG